MAEDDEYVSSSSAKSLQRKFEQKKISNDMSETKNHNPLGASSDLNPFFDDAEEQKNPFTDDKAEESANELNPFAADEEESGNPFAISNYIGDENEQDEVTSLSDREKVHYNANGVTAFPSPSAPLETVEGFPQNGGCDLAANSLEQVEKLFCPIGLKADSQLSELFLKYTQEASGDFAYLIEQYYSCRLDYKKFWNKVNESKTNALDNVKSFWIFSTKVLTSAQTCNDNRVVKFNKEYEYVDFSSTTFDLFCKNWKHVNDTLTEKVFTAYFQSVVLWARVEKYLNNFLVDYISTHKTYLESFRPLFQPRPLQTSEEFVKTQTSMHCILSGLFGCLRKKQPDANFTGAIFEWIEKCCAVLLRSATLFDHLMILNQSLRLPAQLTDARVFKLIHFPSFQHTHSNKEKTKYDRVDLVNSATSAQVSDDLSFDLLI